MDTIKKELLESQRQDDQTLPLAKAPKKKVQVKQNWKRIKRKRKIVDDDEAWPTEGTTLGFMGK